MLWSTTGRVVAAGVIAAGMVAVLVAFGQTWSRALVVGLLTGAVGFVMHPNLASVLGVRRKPQSTDIEDA